MVDLCARVRIAKLQLCHPYRRLQNYLQTTLYPILPFSNCLGIDLAFLRPISMIKRTEVTKGARPTIILVVLDICSRFTQLR